MEAFWQRISHIFCNAKKEAEPCQTQLEEVVEGRKQEDGVVLSLCGGAATADTTTRQNE